MVLTVIGARPQFVKAAVVSKALAEVGVREDILHTGQHYDDNMDTVFWEELGIPAYVVNLNVGSGTHGKQTGTMMMLIEDHLLKFAGKYKAVLVYGDTNSTVAAALVAVKLGLKLIHVEAGLRSFNREMPEEINRVVTDGISDILFCPSQVAVENLKNEHTRGEIVCCGDVMYDAVLRYLPLALSQIDLNQLFSITGTFAVLTLHRPSNVDNPDKLKLIFEQLSQLPVRIIWPVHPRTAKVIERIQLPQNITITRPFSYLEMLAALHGCEKVITDSGGLQKEAYWLKKQCITLRSETEWTETVECGWNSLINVGGSEDRILKVYSKNVAFEHWKPLYGDGNASGRIASIIKDIAG
jgi:UDP-N-acetylglucosamine 2-epimerase